MQQIRDWLKLVTPACLRLEATARTLESPASSMERCSERQVLNSMAEALKASNVIGDTFITQNALIAPGLGFGDAGQINIAGTFNLDGTALYEIGGISSTAYDVINVTGNAVFGGTSKLQVSLFNSFAPSLHDKFDIVLFTAGLGGTFGNSVLPALNTGLSWQINYLADRVQLEVVATSAVPLPASLWLMVSALLGVVSVGRRRVQ